MRKPTGRIGPQLRALRLRLGLTLTEAARRARINKGSLLHVERGDRRLAPRDFGRLIKVLGPEAAELLRPGQLRLALDWGRALRRSDLEADARRLLTAARLSLNGNRVEVWQLPGPVLVLSALGDRVSPVARR